MKGFSPVVSALFLAGSLASGAVNAATIGFALEEVDSNTLNCVGDCSGIASITQLGPDDWTVNLVNGAVSRGASFGASFAVAWNEPSGVGFDVMTQRVGTPSGFEINSDSLSLDPNNVGNPQGPFNQGITFFAYSNNGNDYFATVQGDEPIPAPAPLALLVPGLVGLAAMRRKKSGAVAV